VTYLHPALEPILATEPEHAPIREVRCYGETEGKRVDERRTKGRVGHKKDEALVLTAEQTRLLKSQHAATPQCIRDRLLICLLLDLGLRASEVAALRVEDFAEPGYVTVYRQKTDSVDRMELSADILKAFVAYAPYQRKEGLLLRGSRKNEELIEQICPCGPLAVGSKSWGGISSASGS
jgi:integrase